MGGKGIWNHTDKFGKSSKVQMANSTLTEALSTTVRCNFEGTSVAKLSLAQKIRQHRGHLLREVFTYPLKRGYNTELNVIRCVNRHTRNVTNEIIRKNWEIGSMVLLTEQ